MLEGRGGEFSCSRQGQSLCACACVCEVCTPVHRKLSFQGFFFKLLIKTVSVRGLIHNLSS